MSLADQMRSALDVAQFAGEMLDEAIGVIAPVRAQVRREARMRNAAYEAAQPSRLRKFWNNGQSGDALARAAARPLREQARYLERNYDLARSVLDALTNFTIGPQGIQVEPQPRLRDSGGEIATDFADEIAELWADFIRCPEVTKELSFAQCQRLTFRSGMRDGDVFSQMLEGWIPSLQHGTRVPFSIELIESDLVPTWHNDLGNRIRQGIERNGWGQAVAYHVLKSHPGGDLVTNSPIVGDTRRVPADRMVHFKLTDRIGQTRGVSVFASVITRLEDIRDYENSERIAAKVASRITGAITRDTEGGIAPGLGGDVNTATGQRQLMFTPGMLFDDLRPGESVQIFDNKRPNPALGEFIHTQGRRIAGGTGSGASSITRNYSNNYSAQRQELVETWISYQCLAEHFTGQFVRPTYERFINTAILSGQLRIPPEIDPMSIDMALYQQQAMPWIDPQKEAVAYRMLEEAVFMSGGEIIRRRGGNPREVIREAERFRSKVAALPPSATVAPAAAPEPEDTEVTSEQ